MSELFGANTIDIGGTSMLLTVTSASAVHLAAPAQTPGSGRAAVLEHYLRSDDPDRERLLANYDRRALAEPRWSVTTLCGREWSMMIGGDGGTVSLFRETAFAPTCRRCMAVVDRQFPKPAADDRLALVARLAADKVLESGHVEVHHVPADQQTLLRNGVKKLLRAATSHSVATHVLQAGQITVVCDAIYDEQSHDRAAEAIESLATFNSESGLQQSPHEPTERDWVIDWQQ
ncbi:hypothetical protein O7606_12610 [Micromonospora sp. WMMD882]|uniref:hypothetical protein n=1 Tax=Micromonospora sp. WMMD882 TaxID=3015151 RepID=UPI00248B2730|nr:hypothetical protein [Micromonospora sp. WMMD882]WBB82128.1 hypothetical protein O7606_12610 [Micromonospora sp. WMMD882]